MGNLGTAKNEKKSVNHVVEVVRVSRDNPIGIPDGMTLQQVDKAIHARIEYENKTVAVNAKIDAPFVFEAMAAMYHVLQDLYGFASLVDTPGFFGPEPPTMISVPLGRDRATGKMKEPVQVPLGRFTVPNIDGYLESSVHRETRNGPLYFYLTGEIKRRDEERVNKIVGLIRERVKTTSIYRGEAFQVILTDDDAQPLPLPQPSFLDLDPRAETELVLPERTARSVKANVFTPIEKTTKVRESHIPLKRGILLAGPFGTGKTMIATSTAIKATRNGWTYIEVGKITELADIVRLARYYQPAVVFCEDLDRVMRGEDRTINIDEILNVVDGVESKGTELMIVFTTNELDRINPAMLRPGRLDVIVHVGPPDAAAAERLARQYGRGMIDPEEVLTKSGVLLAGKIPAVIREATERAKLYAITNTADGEPLRVNDDALSSAVEEMEDHVKLLTPKAPDDRSETVKAADLVAKAVLKAAESGVQPNVPWFPVRPSDGLAPDGDSVETEPDDHVRAN